MTNQLIISKKLLLLMILIKSNYLNGKYSIIKVNNQIQTECNY